MGDVTKCRYIPAIRAAIKSHLGSWCAILVVAAVPEYWEYRAICHHANAPRVIPEAPTKNL